MENPFFEHPILNSPYEYPARHWELDANGQPTQRTIEARRGQDSSRQSQSRRKKGHRQARLVFDEGDGLSTAEQQYDPTSIINELRRQVDRWRMPKSN